MLLFRIVFTLVGAALAYFIHLLFPQWRYSPFRAIFGSFAGSFLVTALAGSASRSTALRKVIGGVYGTPMPDPPEDIKNAQRWYIESSVNDGGMPHSCSFVEFDERGDYLDFNQHLHAYEKVKSLAEKYEHFIVVVFVHGWRNSGQSGNVVSFNEFLYQLAAYSDVGGVKHRVHGIYLSWRGSCLKHALTEDTYFSAVTRRYGGDPVVDLSGAARFPKLNERIETFTYFDRKGVPEHLFSGTSLSRTLFTCAHVAKRFRANSHVFLIGHSFGGLMLERTFQNAAIGELIDGWPWGDGKRIEHATANPMPFDTVLLVNSAAPSIYAKQFQSFLAAHRHAMLRDRIVGANAPVFFSLTSSGDWATGKTHPLANTFCFLLPTLQRNYKGGDFILAPAEGREDVSIQQSYYYQHTPGHNPLLVNRFIEPASPEAPEEGNPSVEYFRANLENAGDALEFTTSPRGNEAARRWRINFPPTSRTFSNFSRYLTKGGWFRPVVWQKDSSGAYTYLDTAYWIIRCPEEIIRDHNDIWSQQAMDTYAALYSISIKMRKEKPK